MILGNKVTNVFDMQPVGAHQTDATISSATSFTCPAEANGVLISALAQDVNFTLDGTTPTATVGLTLKADDTVIFIPMYGGQVLKVIEQTATANINLQFVKLGG
jgi:hypothetical protein